ncbi:MAG: cation:dicarboxylase symporter family transporter [Holosporaceae bacterium]
MTWLKSLPLQLAFFIVLGLLLADIMTLNTLRFFITASGLFKDLLVLCMPFIIAAYLTSSMLALKHQSFRLLALIFGTATLSNFFIACFSCGLAFICFAFYAPTTFLAGTSNDTSSMIQPFWHLPLRCLIDQRLAIFGAFLVGILGIVTQSAPLVKSAFWLRDAATFVLKNVFIRLLPLYVFGTALQIQAQGALLPLCRTYGAVFLVTHVTLLLLTGSALYAGSKRLKQPFVVTLHAFLPMAVTALSTFSTLLAMPLLIQGIERLLKSAPYARFIAPLATNIHTIGNSITIPLTALSLFYMAHGTLPTTDMLLLFVAGYCLSRFFGACVPGGGAFVIAPFLMQCLGFSAELLGLFFTLYILQDPLIALWNSLGNASLALWLKPLACAKDKTLFDAPTSAEPL